MNGERTKTKDATVERQDSCRSAASFCSPSLVLSLFPGIGLLDQAFEENGFCVVRGPDILWGGDIHTFHPPTSVFSGVIGGPPCQHWSPLANICRARGIAVKPDLIPEFERCIEEAQPDWFLMENVKQAPAPKVAGYIVRSREFDNRWFGGEQQRRRRISFGTRDGTKLLPEVVLFENPRWHATVTANGTKWENREGRSGCKSYRSHADFRRYCELQGLPADFDLPGFTVAEKCRAVGNGVPLPMGRAIAAAVREAVL